MPDRVALVTGGSGAIGSAICRALAAQSVAIAVHYCRNAAGAASAVQTAEECGVKAVKYAADLSRRGAADLLVRDVINDFGVIDVLVNNAGIASRALLLDQSDDEVEAVMAVNLTSVMHVTRAVIPPMLSRRSGVIINMSSIAASRPWKGQAAYAASKAGLEGFTLAMAAELASRGIRVNAVAPGIVETPMSGDVRRHVGDSLLESIALGRYGTADEIADAVVFLAGPGAAYITGQVLHVDGGRQYKRMR